MCFSNHATFLSQCQGVIRLKYESKLSGIVSDYLTSNKIIAIQQDFFNFMGKFLMELIPILLCAMTLDCNLIN